MRSPTLIATGLLTAAMSCTPSEPPSGPITGSLGWGVDQEQTPAGPTLDDLFLKVSDTVPGFAGLVLDTDGAVVIKLVDTTAADAARENVNVTFRGSRTLPGRSFRFVRVRYSFRQLYDWRDSLFKSGLNEGVRQIDLDEGSNVIRIGTIDDQSGSAVRVSAAGMGIPRDALIIERAGELKPLVDSLGLAFRPLLSGLIVGTASGSCSIGPRAKKTGTTRYILVNAHCTKTYGSVDGDSMGQPTLIQRVAVEVQDPGWTSVGCLSFYVCRWSDAALYQCDSISPCSGYTIAKTTWEYTGLDWSQKGSLELDTSDPWYVVGELSSGDLIQYSSVSKVGFASGWTGGEIASTCFDRLNYPTSGKALRCQYSTHAVNAGGDSGGPVFQYDTTTSTAYLAGLIYGCIDYGPPYYCQLSTFSPIWGVKTDLGAMTVSSPIY